jgi:hypothetical protein
MAMDEFLSDLGGGFQGAGMGASLLGGLGAAKVGFASNPWVAGGLLLGGAGLGVLNSMDPAQKRANRMNERLGRQELEMNSLNIDAEKAKQLAEEEKKRTWGKFGSLFSNYVAGMGQARPTGSAAFAQSLGGA